MANIRAFQACDASSILAARTTEIMKDGYGRLLLLLNLRYGQLLILQVAAVVRDLEIL
jgi:hypothetical protein